jgi:hypothetical protein
VVALCFNTHTIVLGPGFATIEALKSAIASGLQGTGFADIVDNQGEVAVTRAGVRVSVQFLPISGRNFWQVVVAAGEDLGVSQATLNEVVSKIRP